VAGWVLHVDLDQFIAAVEVLRRPELAGLPVVVGGDGDPAKRGVVATASYAAREHGVHSGLPLRTAARRIPDAVFLPVDRAAYESASEAVMTALRGLGYVVEVMGWDEAFVAVGSADAGRADPGSADPEAVARRIQQTIKAATRLDCSVGIGQNKLQAKLATGFGKPAGVFRLTYQNWFEVLGARPTDALWGIGGKTAKRLASLGIATVSDLAATDPLVLADALGPATGPWLVQTARGLSSAEVTDEPYQARGHGRETTFQQNIDDWAEVRAQVRRLAGEVARDVAAEERPAVRIVVKVRYAPFRTYTRSSPLAEPTMDPGAIEAGALVALDRFDDRGAVRLLGVRAEFAPDEVEQARG
jgi:nucleotidyltransferase/DNA polymerase involved in DNA repair